VRNTAGLTTEAFQSAPGGEAGGNPLPLEAGFEISQFQSAPGGEAGGNNATETHI